MPSDNPAITVEPTQDSPPTKPSLAFTHSSDVDSEDESLEIAEDKEIEKDVKNFIKTVLCIRYLE